MPLAVKFLLPVWILAKLDDLRIGNIARSVAYLGAFILNALVKIEVAI